MRRGGGAYAGLFERLRSGFTIAFAGYGFGVLAFYLIGCWVGMNARYGRRFGDLEDDVWTVRHCLYEVGVSFTTIGYQDELGSDDVRVYQDPRTGAYFAYNSHDGLVPPPGHPPVPLAELRQVADYSTLTTVATVTIAFVGMATFIYAIGAITAFFVEGGYVRLRMRVRLQQRIARLRDHVIVCGAGPLGRHAVERFLAEGTSVLVLDRDEPLVEAMRERFPEIVAMAGDPTEIETLREAGLAVARGIVAALATDNENIVVVVTARQENPSLRILSRAEGRDAMGRLRRAGANEVVAPPIIGGMRLASEAVRPSVVRFLDLAMGHEEERSGFRISGLPLPPGSRLEGRTLGQSRFAEETGLVVLALRYPGQQVFVYNPPPEATLAPGVVLGVVGNEQEQERGRAFLAGGRPAGAQP